MPITLNMSLRKLIDLSRAKPYECFFGILAVLVLAPFVSIFGSFALAESDMSPFGTLVFLYLICLALVFVSADKKEIPSAKEFFWMWVLVSVAGTLLAGFGHLEILFLRWLSL